MADDIRQRCGILMQKMTSLRIAVDERMMSFNAMTSEGGGSRPRTAFMRTPRNLSALFERLAENIEETKHLLVQTTIALGADVSERNQIRGLIADLERELNRIAPRLNLRPATTTTTTTKTTTKTTTTTATTTTTTELPAINHSSVAASESETRMADDKESRSLPAIIVCSSDPTGVPTSSIVNPGTLRPRRRHTKTMMLRMQLARDASSTVLKSNQGYPYESSFPKLEPILPSRRFTRDRSRIAGGGSDSNLSRTIESHKRQLKTNELLPSRQRYSRSP